MVRSQPCLIESACDLYSQCPLWLRCWGKRLVAFTVGDKENQITRQIARQETEAERVVKGDVRSTGSALVVVVANGLRDL